MVGKPRYGPEWLMSCDALQDDDPKKLVADLLGPLIANRNRLFALFKVRARPCPPSPTRVDVCVPACQAHPTSLHIGVLQCYALSVVVAVCVCVCCCGMRPWTHNVMRRWTAELCRACFAPAEAHLTPGGAIRQANVMCARIF